MPQISAFTPRAKRSIGYPTAVAVGAFEKKQESKTKYMHRSPIILKLLTFMAAMLCIAAFDSTLRAQTLKADYQFQGNLDSSVAGAPAIPNLNGAAGAT